MFDVNNFFDCEAVMLRLVKASKRWGSFSVSNVYVSRDPTGTIIAFSLSRSTLKSKLSNATIFCLHPNISELDCWRIIDGIEVVVFRTKSEGLYFEKNTYKSNTSN